MDQLGVFCIAISQRSEQALAHDVGEPHDRVERRAQFMAHVGQEAGLARIALFGGGACSLQPRLTCVLYAGVAKAGDDLTVARALQGDLKHPIGVAARGDGNVGDTRPVHRMQPRRQCRKIGVAGQVAKTAPLQALAVVSGQPAQDLQQRSRAIQAEQQGRLKRQQPQGEIGAIIAPPLAPYVPPERHQSSGERHGDQGYRRRTDPRRSRRRR